MKLRHKSTGQVAHASRFNVHGLSEIIVYFEDGGADSDYIHKYDVFLTKTGTWKHMPRAFRDHDLIVDDYNEKFFEPENDEERERGYR